VFDQFRSPQPVGSGLVLQPVGLEVLDAIGAGDAARALGEPLTSMHGVEAENGCVVLSVSYGKTPDRHGLAIHRAALFDVLLNAAEEAGAHLIANHTVTAHIGQSLQFGNGDEAGPFDLVVDACGAKSTLSPLQAEPLPYGAIWATVPWPEDTGLPRETLSQRYRRADRMLGVLPVGAMPSRPDRPMAAVFYSLKVDEFEAWKARPFADWRDEALSLWPEMRPFLHDRLGRSDFTFAQYSHGSLKKPHGLGIVHIGDAAHCTSPQLGQGANMALLDAIALHRALQQRRSRNEALELYAGARRWHVAAYQALSASFTPQYQSDSVVLPVLRDRVLAPLSRTWPLPGILTKLVCGDLVPPMATLDVKKPG